MEPGLDEMWADGICCTGILVRAEAKRVGAALGAETTLVEDGKVVERLEAAPVAYAMSVPGSAWTIVEFNRRMVDQDPESGADYLAPVAAQALGAMSGTPSVVERFIYETPVSAAHHLSKTLGAPAIAIWGSDELPELLGGAFFVDDGSLELVLSGSDPTAVEKGLAGRSGGNEDENDEEFLDDGEKTYVFVGGAKPTIRNAPVEEALDKEFRKRGAAFDNADLLQDIYRLILQKELNDEVDEVERFHVIQA